MRYLITTIVLLAVLFLLRNALLNLLDLWPRLASNPAYRNLRPGWWYLVASADGSSRWRRNPADESEGERLLDVSG